MFPAVASVVGLTDTQRPIVLIGFVVAMFLVAGLAVLVGRRGQQRKQAKALSVDTGVSKGMVQGADDSHSSDWLSEARSEEDDVDDTPKHNWQDLILGPGSVHDDSPEGHVAPELAAQRVAAAQNQQDWEVEPVAPAWGQEAATPPVPAQAPPAPPAAAPVADGGAGKHAARAEDLPRTAFLVDSYLDEED